MTFSGTNIQISKERHEFTNEIEKNNLQIAKKRNDAPKIDASSPLLWW
jgi:hypothetical protein